MKEDNMRIMGANARKGAQIQWIICIIISVMLTGLAADCHAVGGKMTPHHSKDYREFPADSPEAVLTALIESDLGDVFNRGDDDRYPLWWGLTEHGGIPDNDWYLKLYITSYKILNTVEIPNGNDRIINLEYDVRAIRPNPNQKDLIQITWRNVPVYIGNTAYHSASKQFVETILDRNELSTLFNNELIYFPVAKDKRIWVFPVRMVRQNNKWRIAMDSFPLQTAYVKAEIDWNELEMNREVAVNNVCRGKRNIDDYVMEQQLLYVKTEIGKNTQKFKARFCTEKNLKSRSHFIEYCDKTIRLLKSAEKD